jgi:hypothetical protein
MVAAALASIYLRVSPRYAGFPGPGHDEYLYMTYLDVLTTRGVTGYPHLIDQFLSTPANYAEKIVPPTRSLFLVMSWGWERIRGNDLFSAMKEVSAAASILMLAGVAVFAWRLGGPWASLAMLAMMGAAPLQIFNAHRALVDGFMSLWALLVLWLFWECLQRPDDGRLLSAYASSIVLMLLAKESGALVVLAMVGLLALNRWVRWGSPTARLWAVTLLAPLAAAAILIVMCGGVTPLVRMAIYDLKAPLSPYTRTHADGPWYGYVLALLILSPALTMATVAGMFGAGLRKRSGRAMIVFTLLTLIPMACLPYQIVVRLATIWDFPMRWLAWLQILWIAELVPARSRPALVGCAVAALCWLDYRQFMIFFIGAQVYEPVSDQLLWVIKVLKRGPDG